jgi:hypothetical protein
MNKQIVSIFRASGDRHKIYAAEYLEHLEKQRDKLLHTCHLVVNYPDLDAAKLCREVIAQIDANERGESWARKD